VDDIKGWRVGDAEYVQVVGKVIVILPFVSTEFLVVSENVAVACV